MMSTKAVSVVLLLCLLQLKDSMAVMPTPLTDFKSGILTFFGGAPDGMDPYSPSYGTKEGSCGYGTLSRSAWPYFSTAALSPSNEFFQSGPVQACGQCFEVQCDDASKCKKDSNGNPLAIIVQITDKCPECGTDHMDTQALAFAKIADPSSGRVAMKYRRVECVVPDDVKVKVASFAGNNGWLALAVNDVGGRGAIKSVYVKSSSAGDDSWQQLTNTWGATWETPTAPAAPLDIKFFDDAGNEVQASAVVSSAGISGKTFSTGQQFPIDSQSVQAFDGEDPMMVSVKNSSAGRKMLSSKRV